MTDKLEIKAALTVLRPAHDVFEAIVDPNKMSNYFISKSTGPMEQGKTVTWQFPEFDMQFPVHIGRIDKNKFISYKWADEKNNETLVEMTLEPKGEFATTVRITEKSRDNDEAGLTWLKRNTEGWANFLACLKAYMEYGINLRKGAFDISQMPEKN